MRLLAVELSRLTSRRTALLLLVVASVAAAVLAVSAGYATRPPDAAERATAERLLASQAQAATRDHEECLADPAGYVGGPATAADCERLRPTLDRVLARPALDLGAEVDGRGVVLLVLLAGLGLLLGATSAGAEWSHRSIGEQLLFQPRRVRLWSAKALAVVLVAAVGAAAVLAAFWSSLALLAAYRELATPAGTTERILEVSLRGVGLVAATALGAYALTMLLRSAVAPLALLLGYAVVGEGLTASLPFAGMSRWSLPNNVLAWLEGGTRVRDASRCTDGPVGCLPWYDLTAGHAAAYLGVLLGVAVAVSVVAFSRRDV